MFVAYNAFYPPSLANIESRSASPDRSHQAFLDELVNKGLLGLFSYIALIVTAVLYGFNLLKRTSIAPYRYLVIAAMSSIVAHNIEGLTGIPVVASLMLQWLSIAVLICVATLTHQPDPAIETLAASSAPSLQTAKPGQTGRRRPTTVQQKPVLSSTESSPLQYLSSALILVLGISSAWSFNLDNALADMRFQQGTSYAEAATNSGNTDQQIIGLSYFLDAIRMEPNQDYYYLSAGRSLLNLADSKRRIGGNAIASQPSELRELLSKESAIDIKDYIEPRATHDIVKLAESMLLAAHDLNQYNKDHFANLARLYTFWYTRVEQSPELDAAILSWFEKGVANAPNDVSILNEYTGALINRANRLRDTNPAESARMREQAHAALERSMELDPKYSDTAIRIADLRYADGKYTEAMPLYAEILKNNPHALDGQISTIVDQLSGTPVLLEQLRTAYKATPYQNDRLLLSILGLIASRLQNYPEAIAAFGQLVAIQPNSIEALQNYTIVLSNGLEYENAAIQAENLVALATTQQLPEQTVALYQQLVDFLRAKAP
jgi:tetratricopeptide (TPR) repeat protein